MATKYTSKGTHKDQSLSSADKAKVSDLKRQYNEAKARGDTAGMNAAHAAAENIRSGYGYSGGADGTEYISKPAASKPQGTLYVVPDPTPPAKTAPSSGGFSYSAAPAYVSKYQSQIDELTRQILSREAFSYDPESDPAYRQYRDSYTRGAQRAMQDTLGQVAGRTGGLASSYAGSVSQQTYDSYMDALADKVPELRQLAYSMYQAEGDRQQLNLEMLRALDSGGLQQVRGPSGPVQHRPKFRLWGLPGPDCGRPVCRGVELPGGPGPAGGPFEPGPAGLQPGPGRLAEAELRQ